MNEYCIYIYEIAFLLGHTALSACQIQYDDIIGKFPLIISS